MLGLPARRLVLHGADDNVRLTGVVTVDLCELQDVFDSAVWEQQAELELGALPASEKAAHERLVSGSVLRVDHRHYAIEG